MTAIVLVLLLSAVLLPCIHTFTGTFPNLRYQNLNVGPTVSQRTRMLLGRPMLSGSVFNVDSPGKRRGRKEPAGVLKGSEEVEDFEVDMEVDSAKLDVFGTIITQVKMEGRVPASTHLVYDCSHGEWLLAQIAYDRKIRIFSSRSVQQLGSISSFLPENSRFIFSGALIPKQVRRILKMKGLTAVVARDAEGAIVLNDAMNMERARLAAKKLSKVSQSRERFLLAKGGRDNGARSKEPPTQSIASKLRVFVRIQEAERLQSQSVEELTAIIETIDRECANLDVIGLWGGNMNADMCLNMLEAVSTKSKMSQLRVALDHNGPSSSEWYKDLRGSRRGPIMWTFNYEL